MDAIKSVSASVCIRKAEPQAIQHDVTLEIRFESQASVWLVNPTRVTTTRQLSTAFYNQSPRLHTAICRSARKFLQPELRHLLKNQVYIFHGGA